MRRGGMAINLRFAATLAGTLAGFLIWAVHFLVVYVFAALACARGFADIRLLGIGIVPLTVVAATAVALAATAYVLVRALRGHGPPGFEPDAARFLRRLTVATAGLSLVAIAWDGLPALLVPACS